MAIFVSVPEAAVHKDDSFVNPPPGEENLVYKVANWNEVTNRCYIEQLSPLPGLNMHLAPQELVSADEIENL